MSWVLVVQPDPVQADTLREALRAHLSEDVVVAESLDEALSLIDQRVPDVLLLPTLIPAAVEEYLVGYVRAVPGAGHVQILGLPHLERPGNPAPQPQQTRSRFPWRRHLEPRQPSMPGCDPGVFTQDILTYLESARRLKEEIARHDPYGASGGRERRREPRFADVDVPWVSLVSFGGNPAALMNVSARGALLRTYARPEPHLLRRPDPHVRARPHLTLELVSKREVHAMGRVIRCVPLAAGARTQYEIAFAFDDSVGLQLPATDIAVVAHAGSATTRSDRVIERPAERRRR